MELDRREIEGKLKEVIEEIEKYNPKSDVYLILIGGASLILKYGLRRTTKDIDVAVRPYMGGLGDLLSRKGFQVVAEGFLNLPPDYEERLEPVMEGRKVHVLTLSPYDLAVSKISRGLAKDIEDVVNSELINRIDVEKLRKIYFDAIDYWIGDRRKFVWAWEDFEDAYKRKVQPKKALRKGKRPRRSP
ncbi:hypothetical protein HG1285_14704 [Hydrogenivirga sp. 128-5-R1-1]|nr:hypothetical protein HG1285_14704 [Hydrogenivirga sp. 128-5-R1-1]